jgi:lipopolysaccharide heptosyltransferase II
MNHGAHGNHREKTRDSSNGIRSATWDAALKILCVRLDSLGDVLMTTPAIRALRSSRPGRQITLLTSPAGAEGAKLTPEIDEILVYSAPWMKATARREGSDEDFSMIERLRRSQFDAAVIFTVFSQNPLPAAMMCYMAGIPLRLAHCHENPYQLLTDWVADHEPAKLVRHEVKRQLDLVAHVGCVTNELRMSLSVPKDAREEVQRLLNEIGIDHNRVWMVVHAGASAPSRRYPPEMFAESIKLLQREIDCQAIFTGIAEEKELIEQIRSATGSRTFSLCGRLEVSEMAALIEAAPLLISNNTGPVHIAAAVGTPVVDLYALTNPQHTPWAVEHRLLSHDVSCKYCYKSVCPAGHHDCLRLIAPAEVVAAAKDLLGLSKQEERSRNKRK